MVPFRVVNWDGEGSDDVDDMIEGMVRAAEGPGVIWARDIDDAEAYAARLGPRYAAIHSRLKGSVQNDLVSKLRDGELHALVSSGGKDNAKEKKGLLLELGGRRGRRSVEAHLQHARFLKT